MKWKIHNTFDFNIAFNEGGRWFGFTIIREPVHLVVKGKPRRVFYIFLFIPFPRRIFHLQFYRINGEWGFTKKWRSKTAPCC